MKPVIESGLGWRGKAGPRERSELVRMSRMSKTVSRWRPRKPRLRRLLGNISVSDEGANRHGHEHGREMVRQYPEYPCFLLSRWKVFPNKDWQRGNVSSRITQVITYYFDGRYSQKRIWNKAMSPQERPMVWVRSCDVTALAAIAAEGEQKHMHYKAISSIYPQPNQHSNLSSHRSADPHPGRPQGYQWRAPY
jgi:hypothetical protein